MAQAILLFGYWYASFTDHQFKPRLIRLRARSLSEAQRMADMYQRREDEARHDLTAVADVLAEGARG